MFSNRRSYISGQHSNRPAAAAHEVQDGSRGESPTISQGSTDSLYALFEEFRKSMNLLEEKLEYMDMKQKKLENQIEKYVSRLKMLDADIAAIQTELETSKNLRQNTGETSQSSVASNIPIMPGTGFACVTAEYLKNLKER